MRIVPARKLFWLSLPLLFAGLLLFVAAPLLLPFDLRYLWGDNEAAAARMVGLNAVRDPYRQPFSSESPWNRPLGENAQFEPIDSSGFSAFGGGKLNVTEWTHPVYRARATDPMITLHDQTVRTELQLRVPRAALPDPEADGHLHVIDVEGRYVYEMYQASRRGDELIRATHVVKNDLRGLGIHPEWHGVRAYGGSALGGLIREGELTIGIRHSLAVAVRRRAMNANGPFGKPYVWPASSADNGWKVTYGTVGNLHMGSLLAIPPEVDLDSLGLRSRAGQQIATALQTYGAYVTDAADTNIVFYATPDCAAEVPIGMRYDLRRIVEQLRVVINNSADTPGGGGTPVAPIAAPLPYLPRESTPVENHR